MKRLLGALIGAFCLLAGAPALAANCAGFSYTLTNGQVADATQVMANFNTLMTCSNANLAHNGANSDITSLSGLTTPIGVSQGGTGQTTSIFSSTNTWAGGQTFSSGVTFNGAVNSAGANSWTGLQTFSGTTANLAGILTNMGEVATVSATAATGTINYDTTTQSVLYYTTNASANWTLNLRGNGSTSLGSLLAVGQAVTVVHLVPQGASAFFNNVVQVDGTTTGVTTLWQGGAPSGGNISGTDVYTYTVIKTAATPTYTVLATQVQFK